MEFKKVRKAGCLCLLSLSLCLPAGQVAFASSSVSETNAAMNVKNKPKRASLISAASISYDSIVLSWLGFESVDGYYIYRAEDVDDDYTYIGKVEGNELSYTDTGLAIGHRYYYKIAAYNNIDGSIVRGEQSFALNVIPSIGKVDEVKVVKKTYNTAAISWEETPGADGYNVYLAEDEDGDYKKIASVGVTTVKESEKKKTEEKAATKTVLSNLETGKNYYIKIEACKILGGKLKTGTQSEALSVVTKINQVKNLESVQTDYQTIDLSWDKVDGATAYRIYRLDKEGGKYTKVATVTDLAYTDTELITGNAYTYRVCAIRKIEDKTVKGKLSEQAVITLQLDDTLPPTAGEITTSTVQLSLATVEGATGYLIERSDSKDGEFTQIADYTDLEEMIYIDSKLKEATAYYYQVTAYRIVGEDKDTQNILAKASDLLEVTTEENKGNVAVKLATSKVGCSYIWGASGPTSFDCSGLVMWAFKKAGIRSLPHNAQRQYNCTTHISRSELKVGDLVFYGGSKKSINHVAIYIGNGRVVHAANPSSGVKYSSIDSAGTTRPVGYSRVK